MFILLFPGAVRLDLGDAIPRVAYVPMASSLLSIDSNDSEEEISTIFRQQVLALMKTLSQTLISCEYSFFISFYGFYLYYFYSITM